MEGRAVSILGWVVTALSALAAVVSTVSPDRLYLREALIAGLPLVLSGALAIYVLWPKKWGISGLSPISDVMTAEYQSQLEMQECIFMSYIATIKVNDKTLGRRKIALQLGWILFVSAPTGALVYINSIL